MRINDFFLIFGQLDQALEGGGGNSEMDKHPIQGEGNSYTSNDFMPQ